METRYHNYRRPLDSFDENRRITGLIEPGLYRGFDTFQPGLGLVFELLHTDKAIKHTEANNTTQSLPTGVLLTRHGVVVHETESVELSINSNATNPEDRYDLVIYEHQWLASIGGQAGIYSIVQGPSNSPNLPNLPNPKIQITIGHIKIPAGATTSADCTWYKSREKSLGGIEVAFLLEPNIFQALQTTIWSNGYLTPYPVTGFNALEGFFTNHVQLDNVSGTPTFEALPFAPFGTKITVGYYGDNLTIRQGALGRMISAGINQTHGPIVISGDGVSTGLKMPIGTNLSGKFGLRYVELISREPYNPQIPCVWEVINLPERTIELSEEPKPMSTGPWTNLTTLNSTNGNKLDVGTTFSQLNVKCVGKHLHLQGRGIIKITGSDLNILYLVYPLATMIAAAPSGTTSWIAKKIVVQNVTDNTVIDGWLYVNNNRMEFTITGGFIVGKTYNLHLLETILLDEV